MAELRFGCGKDFIEDSMLSEIEKNEVKL